MKDAAHFDIKTGKQTAAPHHPTFLRYYRWPVASWILDAWSVYSGIHLPGTGSLRFCALLSLRDSGAKVAAMATHKEQVLIRYHYQGIEELFDEYADTFEEHLTKGLRYKTPELMKVQIDLALATEALAGTGVKDGDGDEKSSSHRWKRCLDLGCGSGLAGDVYRSEVAYLEGCDISKEMVKICKKKEVYDKAVHNNLMNHLRHQKDDSFDLILSADVVMYLHDNDLTAMIKEVHRVLESGGVLCFSTESLQDASEGETFRRLESERFAHSRKYVLDVAKEHGFECKRVDNVRVRMDDKRPILGDIFVLMKA